MTGVLFALFLVPHLLNTVSALAGPDVYDAIQDAVGEIVHALEPFLLASVAVHIVAGGVRAGLGPRRPNPTLRERAHRWTGRSLAIVVPLHVLGTRGPEWFSDVTTNMSYVTYTLDHWGWVFYPYYTALFVAGAFHMARGLRRAARWLAPAVAPLASGGGPVPRRAARTWALVAVLAVLSLLAIGGWFHDVDRSNYPAFDAYFEALF